MPDINTLTTNFFVNVGDVVQAGESPSDPDVAITAATWPLTGASDRAAYLIDGTNYFGALKAEIAALLAGGTDRFFYTNSWSLGTSPTPNVVPIAEGSFTSAWKADATQFVGAEIAFQLRETDGVKLDDVGPFHPFKDDIAAMANADVDVRFLVWASPFLVNLEQAASMLMQYWAINVHSLQSVIDLRALPKMNDKVVLNTLGHTFGAMHIKMVVCGDSTGFRGYATGIDFAQNRNTPPVHDPDHYWHDVAIKVEGGAASGLYHYFEQLWNEEVTRSAKTFKAFDAEIKSHVDDTPLVDHRETAPIAGGQQHTQVLRTLPTMNFSFFGTDRVPLNCIKRLISGFKQKKISFAESGVFEFRAAQRKAIKAAQQYIYIEDQAFTNLELAGWINARLKDPAVPGLKVILLHMGDPKDPPNSLLYDLMDRLVDGVATPAERIIFAEAPYTIHAKLTIIDDNWASIGSSNCMRRSFYMDGEISVSVVDEAEPSFAAMLRKDLWGEHCRTQPGPDCDPLLNLNDALGIWRPSWGTAPGGFTLRPDIKRKTVPFVFVPCPDWRPDEPPCHSLELHPEAMRGLEPPKPLRPPSPTEAQRDQEDGDSRLEY